MAKFLGRELCIILMKTYEGEPAKQRERYDECFEIAINEVKDTDEPQIVLQK